MSILKNDWAELLKEEFQKDYYIDLNKFLKDEYSTKKIYPNMFDIYNALNYASYNDTKVVILGQDPYHGPNEAHGLCFSVNPGIKIPPSLKNIYKELNSDVGCSIPNNGYLVKWANQGVLMLNTVLTVKENLPNSHKNKGWETFTDKIIEILSQKSEPIIFILWGNNARSKKYLINSPIHYIIESAHPSPFSANKGFFGSRPFSKTNEILKSLKKDPIDWQIDNI